MVRSAAALATVAGARGVAWGQAQSSAPAVVTTFTELRRGVGVFTARGGSIGYLLNADGAVAVDSQYMDTAATCVAGLKTRAPKGIGLLINTHHHADHTGGNKAFRDAVKTIVAQENCVAWQKRVAAQNKTEADQAYADVAFGESWSATFGDEKVWARHHGPGHTGGDAVITFEKADVVHMGDLLFNRAHPNIDRPAGARLRNWVRILERVEKDASADTIFIAGHGRDNAVRCTRADVRHFRDYLAAAVEHAEKGARAGRSKEEVQALAVMPGFEDTVQLNQRLTLGFVLGVAYDEVTQRE